MSLLSLVSSAAAVLAPNHPHGHGHKKGVDSASEADSSSAGQIPVGATQNVFSNLLSSLEEVVGARPGGTHTKP
jgi:hypothetical protein